MKMHKIGEFGGDLHRRLSLAPVAWCDSNLLQAHTGGLHLGTLSISHPRPIVYV